MLRSRRTLPAPGDRGFAMIAAMVCLLVVTSLTTVAVQQTLGSLSATAQGRKQTQSIDAAQAGLQLELANVQAAFAGYSPNGVVHIACPATTTWINLPPTAGASTANTPNSVGRYRLAMLTAVGSAPPSGQPVYCGQQPTQPGGGDITVTVPSGGSTVYVLVRSEGTTTVRTGGPGRAMQALVKVTVPPQGSTPIPTTAPQKMINFNVALDAEGGLSTPSAASITDPAGTNGSVYSGSQATCTATVAVQNNLQAYGPTQGVTGACGAGGSLYSKSAVQITQGVGANVFSASSVAVTGATVGGNIYASGNVTVTSGHVGGSIYANGTVTVDSGATVAGNVFAVGAVAVGDSTGPGTVAGEVESQTGSITYSAGSHSGPAYVSASQSISPCAAASTCARSLPGDFPATADTSAFPTTGSLPAAPTYSTYYYSDVAWTAAAPTGAGYTVVTDNTCTTAAGGVYKAIVAAGGGTIPTVVRTSCALVWNGGLGAVNGGGKLAINANLAIVADGGIDLTGMPGVTTTANPGPNFYLIVPTYGEAGAGVLNAAGDTCAGGPAAGNISLAGDLTGGSPTPFTGTSLVKTFVYTPDSVCVSGPAQLLGKVAAGGQFTATAAYSQQWSDVDPFGAAGPQTYTTNASAQGLNVGLLGTTPIAVSNPPTSVTDNGSPASVTKSVTPTVSLLSGQGFLGAGAIGESVEADSNGNSYACAGVIQPGAVISIGKSAGTCSATGGSGSGLALDISTIPGIGTALSSLADVSLGASAVTTYATQGPAGVSSDSSSVSFANASVTLSLVGGLATLTIPVSLPSGPNQNLLTALVTGITTYITSHPNITLNAVGNTNLLGGLLNTVLGLGCGLLNVLLGGCTVLASGLLAPILNVLSSTLAPIVGIYTNYQTTVGGVFSASGIHIGVLGTALTADIARASAGANTLNNPTTTTPGTAMLPATVLQWIHPGALLGP